MTKSTKGYLQGKITGGEHDVGRLENIRDNSDQRGIDPDECEMRINKLADWLAVLKFVVKNWDDPRDDPEFRKSDIGKALERDRQKMREMYNGH